MGFQVPKLSTSCCGCKLRTGSLIFGYIHLCCLILVLLATIIGDITHKIIAKKAVSIEFDFLESSLLDLYLFAGIVFNLCFLYGCHSNNSSYMLSYILYQLVNLSSSVIRVILHIFLHIMGLHIPEAFLLILFDVLHIYTIFVIYNHYKNLREGILM